MTKEELQNKAVSLIQDNNRVALQWGTGIGKSKVAIDAIKLIKPLKVLLIVAETAHKNNWIEEFNKWDLNYDNIIIECYASLKKYRNTKWDLIIFDEAHHLGSDLRVDILNTIKSEKILLLSATLPDQIMKMLSDIFGEFKSSKVTIKQAIDWGILPKPKVILIPLNLSCVGNTEFIIEEWGLKHKRVVLTCDYHDRWKYINHKDKYPNVTLKIRCTQQQKYNYYTDQFDYWKRQFMIRRQEFLKNKWLQSGSKRKVFLGESKTKYAIKLLEKVWNKRFICFCASIEQAEALGRENAIHSKKPNSLEIIDRFNRKEINHLFAVGMLQEGQNLNDIEVGVIIQLDGQERSFIQKFGRSMRAEDPIQFIFYYKNTRDEEYLKNVIEGIPEEYITNIDNFNI